MVFLVHILFQVLHLVSLSFRNIRTVTQGILRSNYFQYVGNILSDNILSPACIIR
ncbi:unnamed protein product, partial [Rotaria sp. Silwood1]